MAGVLGTAAALYILCRTLEWLIVKRVVRNYTAMVFVSPLILTALILVLWLINVSRGVPDAERQFAFIINLVIAAIILPFIRLIGTKLRGARAGAESA